MIRSVIRSVILGREAATGLVLTALLVVLAFAGPYLTAWSWADVDLTAFREPPSARHWLGTTQTGRDMYAMTLHGMRRSLVVGFLVAVLSTGMAALVGTVAGYAGGWVDRGLMWAVDVLLVFPPVLVVAIVSPALRGGSPLLFVLLLAAVMWTVTSRVVRGMTISLRSQGYVVAARLLGAAPPAVIAWHIVPNLASLLIVDATLNVSAAVVGETGLSYLGFGVRPPDVSLGTIIADGAPSATAFPWLFLPPVIVLVLVVVGVNLVGDGLRDALDPASGRSPA
ncbi:MAG: binding-protein-dependent transport system inner rane component [Actinoallomurus sp.]|nr:binding-protein-dependent transport system inner rane component [Actinoallomurus sp.]